MQRSREEDLTAEADMDDLLGFRADSRFFNSSSLVIWLLLLSWTCKRNWDYNAGKCNEDATKRIDSAYQVIQVFTKFLLNCFLIFNSLWCFFPSLNSENNRREKRLQQIADTINKWQLFNNSSRQTCIGGT